jgi:DNA-binding NarL/FixJ family response regulator
MNKTAFIILNTNPTNNSGLEILKPLLTTQGLNVMHGFDAKEVPDNTRLLFIESSGEDVWQRLKLHISDLDNDFDIILFNIDENTDLANRALLSGIRGVFYETDKTDVMMKGIRLLLDNQLWFRRGVMSSALNRLLQFNKEAINQITDSDLEPVNLTKRERAIISLMSKGAKNKEIADELNISPHTVKTHLYSAFRKTNCRNRIELLSWAQYNIPNELR